MADSLRSAFADAGIPPGEPPSPPDSDGRHPSWLNSRCVGASAHAVERYRERVRPDLDAEQAKRVLYELFEIATFSRKRPDWLIQVPATSQVDDALGYVVIDEEIALPLRETKGRPTRKGHVPFQPFYVVSCLTRLGFEGEVRNSAPSRRGDPAPPSPTGGGRGEVPQASAATMRRAKDSTTSRSSSGA